MKVVKRIYILSSMFQDISQASEMNLNAFKFSTCEFISVCMCVSP